MIELNLNGYYDIFNPLEKNYFPVRILNSNEIGYSALSLKNGNKIQLNYYQLANNHFRNIWISNEFLEKLGFKKDELIYILEDIITRDFWSEDARYQNNPLKDHSETPIYYGYTLFNQENHDINYVKNNLHVNYKSASKSLNSKLEFIKSVTEFSNYLIKNNPKTFSYEKFDNAFKYQNKTSR